MLVSKMNFRQFFVGRPGRRRGAYSVVAEVQTLPSKVLLSAVPIDTTDTALVDTTDTALVDTADTALVDTADTALVDTTDTALVDTTDIALVDTTDTAMVDTTMEEVVTTDMPTPGDSSDAWFKSVQISTSFGITMVSGMVSSSSGNFSNLTITFEGAFNGATASISSDGSFTASVPAGTTGSVGFVNLMHTEGGVTTQIDTYAIFI
jgi:hypothetical protein